MKLKTIFSSLVLLASVSSSFAQYQYDALVFSNTQNSATARFNGLGGQQTSIGGDLTSLYGNPAGLGMFTKSEFSFTPSFNSNKNETSFLSNSKTSNFSHLNLNNIGVVFHSPIAKTENLTQGLISFNFGIGYQKTNFFRNDMNLGKGIISTKNGLGNYFAEQANFENSLPENLSSNTTYVAYYGFLINQVKDDPKIYNANDTVINRTQALGLNSKGNQSNVDFSMGVNISNKIYLGAALGLASINYKTNNLLIQNGNYSDTNQPYQADLINNFDTQGSGVNFKIGAILKPVYEFRIGLSLESPTWYSISDYYSQDLNVRDFGSVNEKGTDNYPFDYRLSTPLKMNGGLSYFIGKNGFITANVSYADYGSINFNSNSATTNSTTKNYINNTYKDAINYSVGAEIKLIDNLMIRGGYALRGNPYRNIENKDYKVSAVSGGLGYRFGNYYIDGAVIANNSNLQNSYSSYNLNNNEPSAPKAFYNTKSTNFTFTIGSKF